MATFYSWEDAGSPARNLTGNHQNKIRQILRACLVDGYGAKPPAGWSMVHEHASGFSMTNGPGTGIVNFASGSNTAVSLYLAESVTDTSGAIVVGANVRSGDYRADDNASVTSRHILPTTHLLGTYASTLRWCVVADEKTFILAMGPETLYNHSEFLGLYVGEVLNDLGLTGVTNFCALGGMLGTPDNYNSEGRPLASGVTNLRNLATGLYGTTRPYAYPQSTFGTGYISTRAPSPFPSRVNLCQAKVHGGSGTAWVGRLRGVAYDDYIMKYNVFDAAIAIGLPGGFTGFYKEKDLGDITAAVLPGLTGSVYLTADPRFW